MKLADTIIRTKINLPFIRPGLVARQRLREKVMEGLHGPLTLVTAPAGFGKTTLIASCVANCGKPVAWLSLDKKDNEPERFLIYLISALQAADPRIATGALQLHSEILSLPHEVILTSIINDLDSASVEIVLVLDDYQVITSPDVNEDITFLLDHCPHTFHLVIATRSDPPLPTARFRARGQLMELRLADLRFTEFEAAQFLNEVMDLRLDEASVAMLEERTEGWIAGLQLAAVSMHQRKDLRSFIENFSGSNRFILDYLLEEVLSSQPPEIQHFLLCTSILKRFSAPLCDAVLGDNIELAKEGLTTSVSSPLPSGSSASILEYLERANLFLIPLDEERRWYRYHHLFADLLRLRLANSSLQQTQNNLHRRASEWFDQNGLLEEAIDHSLAAEDYSTAARQIEAAAELAFINGQYAQITTWTKALPVKVVQNRPWLCVWNAWVQTQMGDTQEIRQWIETAEASAGSDSADSLALANAIAGLKVFETSFLQEYDRAIALAEAVLASSSSSNQAADDFIRCNLLHLLSSMYYATGQLERAEQICRETIALANRMDFILRHLHAANKLLLIKRAAGQLTSASQFIDETEATLLERGYQHYFAAIQLTLRKIELLLEWNRLAEARYFVDRIHQQSKIAEVPYLQVDLYNLLAYSFLIQHKASEAQVALTKAAALAQHTYIWEGLTWRIESLQARLWLETGDVASLRDWILKEPDESASPITFRQETRKLAQARLLLAEGAYREAVQLLERLSQAAENEGRKGSLIEIHILKALALQGQGEINRASEAVECALALAEPEGYARVFIDEGQPVQALLAQWAAQAAASPLRTYAAHLLSQFDSELQPIPSPTGKNSANQKLIEPLSPRELEVLNLMALGLTNQQIANRLVVARGTVKAQAVSIFRKLDASNRTEAVALARQLGILS